MISLLAGTITVQVRLPQQLRNCGQ